MTKLDRWIDATKIYFDMHGETVGRTVFSTYADFLGEDRRASSSNRLLISEQYGNLRNAKVEWLLSDEATAVYAGGQGQEEERVIKFAEDAKRIELGAPYGRVEINAKFQTIFPILSCNASIIRT